MDPKNSNHVLARHILFVVAVLAVLAVGVFVFLKNFPAGDLQKENQYLTTTLKISSQRVQGGSEIEKKSEKTIQVDLAQTPAERTQGLSGRKSLAPDHGLLFIFEKLGTHSFWMQDMLFSIDILWISEEKKIVHIEKNVSPDSYPKIFKPTAPAKYVLEVSAGFSDQNGIEVGDTASF